MKSWNEFVDQFKTAKADNAKSWQHAERPANESFGLIRGQVRELLTRNVKKVNNAIKGQGPTTPPYENVQGGSKGGSTNALSTSDTKQGRQTNRHRCSVIVRVFERIY